MVGEGSKSRIDLEGKGKLYLKCVFDSKAGKPITRIDFYKIRCNRKGEMVREEGVDE